MSTPTTNMSMGKAVDGDNAKTYLETTLGAALDKLDAHDHSGTTHGLSTFTGGLTISAVGLTVTAGNVGVNVAQSSTVAITARSTDNTSGTSALQALQANNTVLLDARGDGALIVGASGGKVGYFGQTAQTRHTLAANATILSDCITLANDIANTLRANGFCA